MLLRTFGSRGCKADPLLQGTSVQTGPRSGSPRGPVTLKHGPCVSSCTCLLTRQGPSLSPLLAPASLLPPRLTQGRPREMCVKQMATNPNLSIEARIEPSPQPGIWGPACLPALSFSGCKSSRRPHTSLDFVICHMSRPLPVLSTPRPRTHPCQPRWSPCLSLRTPSPVSPSYRKHSLPA